MLKKTIKIVFATIFQDAGEATRALEIARALLEYKPEDIDMKIIFLSRGSRFEDDALKLGFEIYKTKPQMSGLGIYQDLKMKPGELIGDKKIAFDVLLGEIEAYKAIKPDFIIHGFWPIGGIARRMLDQEIDGICFLPLPLTEAFIDSIKDIPEQMKIATIIPKSLRTGIIKYIPKFIKLRLPLLQHSYIRKAALELGWKKEPLLNIFSMLRPNLLLVNDLPDYYDTSKFPENVRFTGPLFSDSSSDAIVDPAIREVFDNSNNNVKVFCTLGSSGTKEQLLEIVKVFIEGIGKDWDAVILSPKSVCPISEARELIENRKGIYITDAFVPAKIINQMADITICHGGQGTIQTAIYAGTPIVGIAMQPEQQMHLDRIVAYGAGIRVPYNKWNALKIRSAIKEILSNKKYKENANDLMMRIKSVNGKTECAKVIWEFILSRI